VECSTQRRVVNGFPLLIGAFTEPPSFLRLCTRLSFGGYGFLVDLLSHDFSRQGWLRLIVLLLKEQRP
jgi:hypothetical protein